MDFGNFLIGSTLLGTIAACWSFIKGLGWRFMSVFIQKVEIWDTSACESLIDHCLKHFKTSPIYDKVFGVFHIKLASSSRFGMVPYERLGVEPLLMWNGYWPVYFYNRRVKKATTTGTPARGSDADSESKMTVYFLRGTLDFEALFREAMVTFNQRTWKHEEQVQSGFRRFWISHVPEISDQDKTRSVAVSETALPWFHYKTYKLLGYNAEDITGKEEDQHRLMEVLVFPPDVVEAIKEIKRWRNSREWYLQRRIPWKRGWALYGPPGTGKSCLVRAFAEDLDLPLVIFHLGELTNREFKRAWFKLQNSAPCIALIEDFDNVFHGRENVSPRAKRSSFPMMHFHKGGQNEPTDVAADKAEAFDESGPITFDTFLNCVDGADRYEGVFMVITTNKPEVMDEALARPVTGTLGVRLEVSRPGRIDRAIELTYITTENKHKMASLIARDDEAALEEIQKHIAQGHRETPAMFQNYCCLVAERHYWQKKEQEDGRERAGSNDQPVDCRPKPDVSLVSPAGPKCVSSRVQGFSGGCTSDFYDMGADVNPANKTQGYTFEEGSKR